MKIAIISDIHENVKNLNVVLDEIREQEVERILCLGDLINPGVAKILASFEIPTFAVWGNNDGDKVMTTKISLGEGSNLRMGNSTYDFVEFEGRKIFLTHHDDIAVSMAKSGDFDAVFYGHNHEAKKEMVGKCLVLNPGEISTHKTGKLSFAVYDMEANDGEIIML